MIREGSHSLARLGRNLGCSPAWLLVAGLAVGAVGRGAEAAAPADLELGIPFFRNFSPREYGAQPQNWCVIQAPRG